MIQKAIHKLSVVWVKLSNRRNEHFVTVRGQNALVLLVSIRTIPILPFDPDVDRMLTIHKKNAN